MRYARYCPEHWTILVAAFAQDAVNSSGLSDLLYCQLLSEQVDWVLGRFSHADQASALEIARHYGYAELSQRNSDGLPGFCTHGFDFSSCPQGCG